MLLPSGLQSQLWAEPMGLAQTTWKVQVAGPPPPEMFTVFVPIWYAWAERREDKPQPAPRTA